MIFGLRGSCDTRDRKMDKLRLLHMQQASAQTTRQATTPVARLCIVYRCRHATQAIAHAMGQDTAHRTSYHTLHRVRRLDKILHMRQALADDHKLPQTTSGYRCMARIAAIRLYHRICAVHIVPQRVQHGLDIGKTSSAVMDNCWQQEQGCGP